jgi:hypothetical protein
MAHSQITWPALAPCDGSPLPPVNTAEAALKGDKDFFLPVADQTDFTVARSVKPSVQTGSFQTTERKKE